MAVRYAMLIALTAAVTVTSAAAAWPVGTKQRVAITLTTVHESSFVLIPLQGGEITRDNGTGVEQPSTSCHDVIRDGQKVGLCKSRWTLMGKQGTLLIRSSAEWVNPGSGGCGIAVGTWSVMRGTGSYAGVTGGGRSAYDAHCTRWYARHEGLLTLP